MKAYITCPVSHSQSRLKYLPVIAEVATNCGLETFVFQVGGDAESIFVRDYEQLSTSQLLIAEVSEQSHGVGIEIGLSYCLGLMRILLQEQGRSVTKLAQGMPNTMVIVYRDVRDLVAQLTGALMTKVVRDTALRPTGALWAILDHAVRLESATLGGG